MALGRPDPGYTYSRQAASSFRLALKISVGFALLLWIIFFLDKGLGLELTRFGLRPGSNAGTIGILTVPLLHGNLGHISGNSLPLVLSLCATLYLYPHAALRTIPGIWIGSGILAWIIGRPSLHYGASGLIYGLLAFVFVAGLIRRDTRSVSVTLLVGFLYGSMVWGVLPIRPHMSWELHLCGAIMGVLFALIYRNRDRLPVKRYDWEDDDSVPEWYPEQEERKFRLPDRDPP